VTRRQLTIASLLLVPLGFVALMVWFAVERVKKILTKCSFAAILKRRNNP